MKRLLLALGLALGIGGASAQVNFVPQVGVNSANLRQNTYSAAIKALVPAAATTDFFCINGSATKRVLINRIELSGSGTAIAVPVYLNHNSALDTGTKAVAATYGPVPNPINVKEPAATATATAYNTTGGNPTIGGTVTLIRSGVLAVQATTVGSPADRLVWNFGTANEAYNMHLGIEPLATPVEQYCLNLVGTSPTAVLEGYIEWTEY